MKIKNQIEKDDNMRNKNLFYNSIYIAILVINGSLAIIPISFYFTGIILGVLMCFILWIQTFYSINLILKAKTYLPRSSASIFEIGYLLFQ